MQGPFHPAISLSERLANILHWVRHAAAARAGRHRPAAPIVLLLWPYLHRVAARFDKLMIRLNEGRPAALSAPRTDPRAATRTRPVKPRLPSGFGWLIRLAPETIAFGSQLQHLLNDPEMTALLAASPQAGRILRPLCKMLGLRPSPDVPAALFPPRRTRERQPDPPPRTTDIFADESDLARTGFPAPA